MDSLTLSRHFDAIASSYRTVRTTDDQHISHIHRQLPDRPLVGIDIGAGTGRYTERLLDALPPQSLLVGADFSHSMLVRLAHGEERHRVPTVACISERLPFAGVSADFVTTFNAVHHFDLSQFVHEIARAALYLASREAGFVTGTTIIVDGGQIIPESMEALAEA